MSYPKAEHLRYQSDGVLVDTLCVELLFVFVLQGWQTVRALAGGPTLTDGCHGNASSPIASAGTSRSHSCSKSSPFFRFHTPLFLLCRLSGIGIHSAPSCWLTCCRIQACIRNHRAKRLTVWRQKTEEARRIPGNPRQLWWITLDKRVCTMTNQLPSRELTVHVTGEANELYRGFWSVTAVKALFHDLRQCISQQNVKSNWQQWYYTVLGMHNIAEPYQIYWVSANIEYLIVQRMFISHIFIYRLHLPSSNTHRKVIF